MNDRQVVHFEFGGTDLPLCGGEQFDPEQTTDIARVTCEKCKAILARQVRFKLTHKRD